MQQIVFASIFTNVILIFTSCRGWFHYSQMSSFLAVVPCLFEFVIVDCRNVTKISIITGTVHVLFVVHKRQHVCRKMMTELSFLAELV